MDTTHRTVNEAARHADEARYRTLFNAIDEGFCVIELLFDADGTPTDYRFEEVNASFARHAGLTDVIGRTICELVPDHDAAWLAFYADVARTGVAARRQGGSEALGRIWDAYATPMPLAGPNRLAVLFRDVSERMHAEQRLRDAEARFRHMADAAPAMLWITNQDGTLAFISRGWYEHTGQSEVEAFGRDGFGWLDAIHPEDRERSERVFLDASRDRQPFALDYRLRCSGGAYRWAMDAGRARFDKQGGFCGYVGSVIDVHERKVAEEAVREAEARLRTMADTAPVLIWQTDAAGASFVNRHFLDFFGVAVDGVSGMRWTGLAHPDDLTACLAAHSRALQRREPYEHLCRFRRYDGEYRWLKNIGTPHFAADGTFLGLIGCLTDVTDEKRAEAALRESEERFRQMADTMAHMIWITRPDGYHEWYNRRWYEFTGVPEGSTDGEGWNGIFHPDDQARAWARWRQSLATGEPYEIEYRLRHRDGEYRWVLGRAMALRDTQGHNARWYGTCTDIHLQKAAEAALRENEARLRLAMEASSTGMWSWDIASGRVVWSPECYSIHGVPPGQFDGTTADFDRLLHPEDRARVWAATNAALQQRTLYQCEFRLVRPDKQVRWVTNLGRCVYDDNGNPVGMVGTINDVTDRKLNEVEREHLLAAEQAARSAVERMGRIKDDFLATLSHELRTPLNAIVGWAHILQRTGLADAKLARDGIEAIARNAAAQAQLIDDLLDMNRIVSGKLILEAGPLDPNTVASAAAETVAPVAEAKGVQLRLHLASGLPAITGDLGRLRQVLWNLLVNGVKFTKAGGQVTLSTHSSDECVRFVVDDSGEGIDPGFLPKLFDRFSQADASATRKHGGLGLGLSIVKQLVELHGGSVHAESQGVGRGARFIVALPVRPSATGDAGAASLGDDVRGGAPFALSTDTDLSEVMVLLVDDQLDSLEVARRLLAEAGASVMTATSARAALEQLQRARPHILISDVGMPEMDGYRLIREVRETLQLDAEHLPAAALTAFVRGEDERRALAAGFQAHLPKPLRPEALLATVAALTRHVSRPDADKTAFGHDAAR